MKNIIYKPFTYQDQTYECVSFSGTELVMNWKIGPGGKVDSHTHTDSDEYFEIVQGTIEFRVGREIITKKEGENLLVKKGEVHAVRNNTDKKAEIKVTYSPCGGVDKMFKIMATLNESHPGKSSNLAKYVYISQRLGLREFLVLQPKIKFTFMSAAILIIGKILGWDQLVSEFEKSL